MTGIPLIAAGMLFALLFILITVIRAAQGREKVGFFETLLAFLVLMLPMLALMNNSETLLVNAASIGIAAVVIIISFMTLLIEQRHSGRKFNQRRGVLGIGTGVLLVVSIFIIPLVSRMMVFSPVTSAQTFGSASSGGLVNIVDTARVSSSQPVSAMQILVEETGLDSAQIMARLNGGETIASIVSDTGGDLEQVIAVFSANAQAQTKAQIAAGNIPEAQANRMLDNLENIIVQGVHGELPQMVYDQLFTRLLVPEASVQSTPTHTPSTPVLQLSATPTRLPSSTPTPTNTPYVLVSPTSGTLVTSESQIATVSPATCLAVVQNNLNLRSGPGLDYQLLLTLPSSTTLDVSARNEASNWWFVQYQAQTGWVLGDYLMFVTGCADLPVRAE